MAPYPLSSRDFLKGVGSPFRGETTPRPPPGGGEADTSPRAAPEGGGPRKGRLPQASGHDPPAPSPEPRRYANFPFPQKGAVGGAPPLFGGPGGPRSPLGKKIPVPQSMHRFENFGVVRNRRSIQAPTPRRGGNQERGFVARSSRALIGEIGGTTLLLPQPPTLWKMAGGWD